MILKTIIMTGSALIMAACTSHAVETSSQQNVFIQASEETLTSFTSKNPRFTKFCGKNETTEVEVLSKRSLPDDVRVMENARLHRVKCANEKSGKIRAFAFDDLPED